MTVGYILRDPPDYAVRTGQLDPDLPICVCGEQVAVAHKECLALQFLPVQTNQQTG